MGTLVEQLQKAGLNLTFSPENLKKVEDQIKDMKTFATMITTLEGMGIDLKGLGADVQLIVDTTEKIRDKMISVVTPPDSSTTNESVKS